jgi:hypothetical protein
MSITLECNGTTIEVVPPQYGYSVNVNMAIEKAKSFTGYFFFDNGNAFDYRTIKGAKHLSGNPGASLLFDFILGSNQARDQVITLHLGSTPTGWFPAGPDKGDTGDFTIEILNYDPSGMLLSPYKYFNHELELKISALTPYGLPAQVPEGDLIIGSVAGLSYPEAGFGLRYGKAGVTTVSKGGVVSNVGIGYSADMVEVQWKQHLNQSNAAALVNQLVVSRNLDINVLTETDFYFAGPSGGNSGTYVCNNLNLSFEIIHKEFDFFEVPMSFWIKDYL